MPIYEYLCHACGHELEAIQRVADDPLVHCPECGEATLRKKVSAAAFRLKGTGWYETDFKHKQKAKDEKKPTGAKETATKSDASGKRAESTDTASKESKSESKSESSKSAAGKTS